MRPLHRAAFALALLAAISALADEEPDWTSIIVRFDVDRDGGLHITEQAAVDVPPSVQRLERTYWSDVEHEVTFDAITLYDGDRTVPLEDSGDLDRAHHFRQQAEPGKVVWSVRDKDMHPDGVRSLTYVIESHVSDSVIPAWSIPLGDLSKDPRMLSDPRARLRDAVALWREARKNPRHRFVVDYLYDMPPPSTKGTEIQLQIYWPAGWKPVHEITPDTVAREINRDPFHPDQWRVTHLFEEDSRRLLTSVDVPRHAIRMAALIGFPILGVLFWLAFVGRELLRRRSRGIEDGEQLAREVVYNEAPEVVEARWSGRAPSISIEQFLRRLEREHKIALTVDENRVAIRLLVSRERLPPYEQAAVYTLMPEGWETTSDEIQQRHKGENFDPADALRLQLLLIAHAAKKRERAPWYSRYTSLAIFLTGAYFAFQETVRYHRAPVALAAALIASAMLFSIWPSGVLRDAMRDSLKPSLFLLIPLAIMTAVVIAIHFASEAPPGIFAGAGSSVMLLGTYKAILASCATRGSSEIAQLGRARPLAAKRVEEPHATRSRGRAAVAGRPRSATGRGGE